MGGAKREMMEHQENPDEVASYLVDLKVLQRCIGHGTLMDGGTDLNKIWAIAIAERNKGEMGRVPWAAGLEAREYTDILEEAYENN